MKSSSNARNGIPRWISSSETATSLNPCSQKHQKLPRRARSGSENVDPNTILDPSLQSHSPVLKPSSVVKIKSPLPPRPPSNPLKRKLCVDAAFDNCASAANDSGVQVIVRIRPPNKEEEEGKQIVQKISANSLSILDHVFTFDSVSDTDSSQQDIFELVGIPLVENCLAGFNSSIFAYGQTGSGKTYTIWGPPNALVEDNLMSSQQKGLTPRVFEQLFTRINEEQVKQTDKQLNYQCRCSFLEIYNEQITDLLDPNQRNLQIREDVKSGVYVENLTEEDVCTMKDISKLLIKGLANRRIGATTINAESSRSHSVFTCIVESRCKGTEDGLSSLKISRINLVDLAGSERQKLTGAAGERLKEAGNINRSLSQLGNLINILAEVSQSGKHRHIPYRDSRLTFLLQESLGGNAKLAMICTISPAQSCKSETFSTLRFAQRAKAIKNKAVVNEVTEDDVKAMRQLICQLKDELQRIKSNGSYSTGWDARRSLNLLRSSFNHPVALACIEGDSDEEMEIDEEDVEKLCLQVGLQQASSGENAQSESLVCKESKAEDLSACASGGVQDIEVADINMEDCHPKISLDCLEENMSRDDCEETVAKDSVFPSPYTVNHQAYESNANEHNENATSGGFASDAAQDRLLLPLLECDVLMGGLVNKPVEAKASACINVGEEKPCNMHKESKPPSIGDSSNTEVGDSSLSSPADLSIILVDSLPVLKSPTSCISPRNLRNIRKSLKTSIAFTASGSDVKEGIKSLKNGSATFSSGVMINSLATAEILAANLHRGLQIIESHQQNSALRKSSFKFSCNTLDIQPFFSGEKVDVGVQTLQQEQEIKKVTSEIICGNCKAKMPKLECEEANVTSELPLVPVVELHVTEKPKKQVPKAVEKVLAGAIRREMALEEYCTKQAAKITQLNRLVQQYKHERKCNAVIAQTREDKICRLEGLMDGVLPKEDFMEEEFISLVKEHKLLKEKFENHPEVLQTKIVLKGVQEELGRYQNFFDMGERDVLIEEIQDLRRQLQYYIDSIPKQSQKLSPLIQLTYPSKPVSDPLCTISESTEETVEEKFEEERRLWNEREIKWISLSEELKLELEASRSVAEKQKQELESEKKCSEELKEALQMAMQGHANILEQYADLQEKHMALLARHRKITDGVQDVKRAAVKAGVKGAESKFLNSLAAEISALKVEREKERRYFRDENKGLQAQLRDTAEAVQAAGELIVHLKEAEAAATAAENRVILAEQVANKAHQEIDELKKKYDSEINLFKQALAEAHLPKEALRPVYDDDAGIPTKYDGRDNKGWRQESEPPYDSKFSRTAADTSSWFIGYDKCNI